MNFLRRHTNGQQVYEKSSVSLVIMEMQIKTTKKVTDGIA